MDTFGSDVNTFIQTKSTVLGASGVHPHQMVSGSSTASLEEHNLPMVYTMIIAGLLVLVVGDVVITFWRWMRESLQSFYDPRPMYHNQEPRQAPEVDKGLGVEAMNSLDAGGLQCNKEEISESDSDISWQIAWADVPSLRLEQLVARAPPQKVAVVTAAGDQLTYFDLEQKSSSVAVHIWQVMTSCNASSLCGLCVEKSAEMMFGILGILKAGAGYVPLPPTFPDQRLSFMVKDCGMSVIVTVSALIAKVSTFAETSVKIDIESALTKPLDEGVSSKFQANQKNLTPDDVFAIIYTSGSTGQPKGVELTHRAEATGVLEHARHGILERHRVLQQYALQFDPHITDIFATFAAHATLVLGPRDQTDMVSLNRVINDLNVNAACWVPSVFSAFVASFGMPEAPMQWIGFGGEVVPVKTWTDVLKHPRVLQAHNCYGPTECAITTTMFGSNQHAGAVLKQSSVPIGRPIKWRECMIVDPQTHEVLAGRDHIGELWIAGPGLAKGYMGRPELTAEKFVCHPKRRNEIAYRSGDLVQWSATGDLLFCGRIDNQVKLHGLRIELSEIETILRTSDDVSDCAVVMHESERLVAFLTPQTVDAFKALSSCTAQLPSYMVPSVVVPLSEFPRTQGTGKVDGQRLRTWPLEGTTRNESIAFIGQDSLFQMRLLSTEAFYVWNLLGVAAVLMCLDHWCAVITKLSLPPAGKGLWLQVIDAARCFDHNICVACAAHLEVTAMNLDGKRSAFQVSRREGIIVILWICLMFPIPELLSALVFILTGGDHYKLLSGTAHDLVGMRWFLVFLCFAKLHCSISHALRVPGWAQLGILASLYYMAIASHWSWPLPFSLLPGCVGAIEGGVVIDGVDTVTCPLGWSPSVYLLYVFFYVAVVQYASPLLDLYAKADATVKPSLKVGFKVILGLLALGLAAILILIVDKPVLNKPTWRVFLQLGFVPVYVLSAVAFIPYCSVFVFMGRHILCTYTIHVLLGQLWVGLASTEVDIYGLRLFTSYAALQPQVTGWFQGASPEMQGFVAVVLLMLYAIFFCGVISPCLQWLVLRMWQAGQKTLHLCHDPLTGSSL